MTAKSPIDWRNVSLVLDESEKLENARQHEKAFSFLSKAIRSVPDEMRYRLRRGMLLCIDLGRFKKGFADLHAAAIFAAKSPHPQQALCLCYRMAGDIESARNHALRAIELDKADASSYYELACCELASEKWEAAIAQLEIALQIRPEYELAWSALGRVLQSTGQLDQAELAYQKALAITQDASNYLSLAQVQLKQGNKQDAIRSLEQANKFDLDNVERVLIDGYLAIAARDA